MKRFLIMTGMATMLLTANTFASQETKDMANSNGTYNVTLNGGCITNGNDKNNENSNTNQQTWDYIQGLKDNINSDNVYYYWGCLNGGNNNENNNGNEITPDKPNTPEIEKPEIPNEPNTPEVEKPEIPNEPNTPEVEKPETPNEPEIPETPNEPNIPNIPDNENGDNDNIIEDNNPSDEDYNINGSMAEQVLSLVNAERRKNGLNDLKLSSAVTKVAQAKSEDMMNNNYFSHTSPTYGSPFDMLKQFGVSYSYAGENIAKGQTSAKAVVDAWLNSSGHRANILNSNFEYMGLGYVKGNGSTYWTQMFIK